MGRAEFVPTDSKRHPANGRAKYSEGCAWVRVRGGYDPDVIEARAGGRLRIVFRREETAPCSSQVVIPSLGKSVMLPPFEDVPVELGPLPAGEHEFRCEFGVLRGRIVVLDEPAGGAKTTLADPEISVDDGQIAGDSAASARRSRLRRPSVNIAPPERFVRVLLGLAGIFAGLLLLASAAGPIVTVLEVLLVLAGLDLLITGVLGHCPLYRWLGYTPPSLRRAR